MKKSFILGLMVGILSISLVIAGVPLLTIADVVPSNGHATITIPSNAIEVAPDIFDIGTSVDVDGRVVQGYAIIDRKDAYHHRTGHSKGPGGSGDTKNTCFTQLSKGAKWKFQESYLVDPTNTAGLNESFVRTTVADAIDEWEASGSDIIGNEVAGVIQPTTIGKSVNGQNEMIFGNIASPGAIAVTFVWGYFSGPPGQREIVEWDKVYDQVDFNWSATGEQGKMDFENIVQHELGHVFGLGHPNSECTEETMYAFASFGETKKRTLNAGDIAGIQSLYG